MNCIGLDFYTTFLIPSLFLWFLGRIVGLLPIIFKLDLPEVFSEIQKILQMLGNCSVLFIVTFLGTLILAILMTSALAMFSISFGSEAKFNSLGIAGPIIVYLLASFLLQIVSFITTIVFPGLFVFGLVTGNVEFTWQNLLVYITRNVPQGQSANNIFPISFIPGMLLLE